ncbi:unnamed protein product [Caenorhabditis bovis]|uniref:PH domain-containing protein n=1 Tax=Caenorhabditis bovis TaxID=2654633 RepID=A0A8S1EFC6_9PELO|nr:unnamed protein product [Caenorhabditis bovis]
MLANANSLFKLGSDPTFERRFSGALQLQQDFSWRSGWGVLKANILFVYNKPEDETTAQPFLLLIIEDCFIELCDENKIGKDFTFEIKFKSTGRSFIFASKDFKSLGKWAYHSKFDGEMQILPLGNTNMGKLPLRTNFKGPAPHTSQEDVIDEALTYFKPNIFFREFEIKGPADRMLIYLIFYITECLRKLQRSPNKISGQKDLAALALNHQLPIPGENGFPLNSMYKAPTTKADEDEMRAYLQQARQELGARLCDLAFPDPNDKPSKWWLCFARRRFMDKGLVSQGVVL